MGRKKAVGSSGAADKARVELRVDPDVFEKMKDLTERAGISINQFVQGLVRWAVSNGHAGEPTRDEDGAVRTRTQLGCVWVGTEGASGEDRERIEDEAKETREDPKEYPAYNGRIHMFLDFTERRVVREDDV